MYKEKLLMILYAQTPLHPGSGTSVSYVDLPIQREKHTDYPMIAASGIKGVIRDFASRRWDENKVDVIFGPEDEGSEYASCIAFTDARILLFPVRSVRGVFAYITCPGVLNRFKRDLESIGMSGFPNIKDIQYDIMVCSNSELKVSDNQIALEEFVFEVDSQNCDEIANFLKNFLPNDLPVEFEKYFAIVSDDTFRDFTKYAVEIRTRIRIEQTTGTVGERALFSMELIPSESVFYCLLFITDPRFGIDKGIYDKFIKGKRNTQSFDNVYNQLSNEEKSKLDNDEEKKEKFKKAYEEDYFTAEEIKKIFMNNNKESENKYLDLNNSLVQIGGDETLGMGLMKVKIFNHSENPEEKSEEIK